MPSLRILRPRGQKPTQSSNPSIHVFPEPPSDGSVKATRIDFASYDLREYRKKFAMVIDNLFTPSDLSHLMSITNASVENDDNWKVATVNGGPEDGNGEGYLLPDYRKGQRIIVDDQEMVDGLLVKMRPYLREIERLDYDKRNRDAPIAEEGQKVGRVKLARLNERLRFLRYKPGDFFKRHCDGLYYTSDYLQSSYITLQIYMNGDPETLQGGATRIYSRLKDRWTSDDEDPVGPCLDIPPRQGRVLIFEQDGILHSGEKVRKGVKVSVRTEFMYQRY